MNDRYSFHSDWNKNLRSSQDWNENVKSTKVTGTKSPPSRWTEIQRFWNDTEGYDEDERMEMLYDLVVEMMGRK